MDIGREKPSTCSPIADMVVARHRVRQPGVGTSADSIRREQQRRIINDRPLNVWGDVVFRHQREQPGMILRANELFAVPGVEGRWA